MKNGLFIMIIFTTCITNIEAKANHAPEALVALSKKLTSLQSISFHYFWESRYPENDYHSIFEGSCYLEFNETDKQTVSRFRMECDDFVHVYNGTELFLLDKKEKTYEVNVQPTQRSFCNLIFFFNNIQTLRSVIQQWIVSDSIMMHERDTLIQNKSYKLVQVDMHPYPLNYLNNFEKMQRMPDSLTLYYAIIIDPETGLPYQIVGTSNKSKSINKTVFTNTTTRPKAPETNSWYFTTYQNEYTPKKEEKSTPLIAVGAVMPEWSLPEYNGKDDPVFKSSEGKGKLVMLDFWIKNCGYCMESFPELRRLQETYGSAAFQLVSINAWEKREQIDFFYKREKPLYKMLYNGEAMAKEWGVNGYPTVVLIDKTGKVIYSGNFNYTKVEALIKANL